MKKIDIRNLGLQDPEPPESSFWQGWLLGSAIVAAPLLLTLVWWVHRPLTPSESNTTAFFAECMESPDGLVLGVGASGSGLRSVEFTARTARDSLEDSNSLEAGATSEETDEYYKQYQLEGSSGDEIQVLSTVVDVNGAGKEQDVIICK